MKIYQATIVTNNSCYIETLLVIAKDKTQAHKQLCKHEEREVKYTRKLKEIEINMTKPNVIEYVGFGNNESKNHRYDVD